MNFADLAVERRGFRRAVAVAVDDGHSVHAPVDAFTPNGNGLFCISGNVSEWCRDWTKRSGYLYEDIVPGTGEHIVGSSSTKPIRGGSFLSDPGDLRLSRRYFRSPRAREEALGIRPSRRLDQE